MAVFKCRMCEASLEITGNSAVVKCEYCGTYQSVTTDEEGTIRTVLVESVGNPENLLKRGNLSLEDRKWDDAAKYFDRVLDINVEEPRAYIGKLLAENRVQSLDELWEKMSWGAIKNMDNYKKAYRFADGDLKQRLDEHYIKWAYKTACAKAASREISDLQEAVRLFTDIDGYEDSRERAEKLRARIFDLKNEAEQEKRRAEIHRQQTIQQEDLKIIQNERRKRIIILLAKLLIAIAIIFYFVLNIWILPEINYKKAMTAYESGDYDSAIALFENAGKSQMLDASYYAKGMQCYEKGDYSGAISAFKAIDRYGEPDEMLKASYYGKAMECYNSRNYNDARYYFREAKGYNDSESMIEKIDKIIKKK